MNAAQSPDQYLKVRVMDQIAWYDKKAVTLKKRHRWMKGIMIALGVLIPVMVSLNDLLYQMGSYLAAVFGAAISAIEGISGMLKDHETFISYRGAREALMREMMLYTTSAGAYINNKTAFQTFVDNCEGIMGSESAQWRERLNQEPKEE